MSRRDHAYTQGLAANGGEIKVHRGGSLRPVSLRLGLWVALLPPDLPMAPKFPQPIDLIVGEAAAAAVSCVTTRIES